MRGGPTWGGRDHLEESMDTLALTTVFRHTTIRITTTRPTEFVDLTDRIEALVSEASIRYGFVNVQSRHTTTAIIVNELEPLLLADFATLLEKAAPRDAVYRHDDVRTRTVNVTADERVNGHAHCQALLLSPSVCLNVKDGNLALGRWQRVLMVELDGPRLREVSIVMLGEGRR